MEDKLFLTTDRLLIKELATTDAAFIYELLNTEGWLKFIGNRNINSLDDAEAYIQKVLGNENLHYRTVTAKDTGEKLGIVTFIKRDYLEHHDIGFAFLARYSGRGYAYEATAAVLNELIRIHQLPHILATTLPDNVTSIKLLEKLGLTFDKEIMVSEEKLHLYGMAIKKN